ncbi:autotransporter outer membrane beta-barrel domain-containing protein [Stenotrophomonas sp. BIIR7]|nr:autotransporter outer membrane beta-barrel domain-containing protein [Stenotrophomonas sp. BIIR7]
MLSIAVPAWAACDNTAPTSLQTVTCASAAPNPFTSAIASTADATGLTVQVSTGAQLAVSAGNAIFLQGGSGHTIINDGSISSASGTALSLNGATRVINRGTINGATGGIVSGAGNDQLEMLGGNIAGAVVQGAGDDSVVISGGTISSIDQGAGQDSLEISGGTVSGIVQQGGGIDTFLMTGGANGALLQGDALDRFRMTDGRIVGAFEDGDYAEMTGGRIGRVNMKLDDNTFLMSGGTIDGNLVTGFGTDTIVLSDGYIGGNISVSGGNDAITITGGAVRGEIRLSFGNDSLDWNAGGVVYGAVDLGEGDDRASLTNLNLAHLGALPLFDGGLGTDSLGLDNVKTNGVARFTGWEAVALRDDSQLTFDGDLRLGDAGSGTGTLAVDATSTLFAGGINAGIVAFNAALPVGVTNAGRIDLSNAGGGAGDVFTIAGNYTGNGGALYLDTVLGADDSASDRLVISNGVASGTTGIGILHAGGTGAETVADGILVVQAINGASTSATAFALYNPVAAGAFEYFLFKGGASAGSGENWYLRSTVLNGAAPAPTAPPPGIGSVTPEPPPPEPLGVPPAALPPPPSPDLPESPNPVVAEPEPPPVPADPAPVPPPQDDVPPPVPTAVAAVPGPMAEPPTPDARPSDDPIVPLYRLETGLYSVVPPLLRETSLASLGTFHERQGEQRLLAGQGGFRAAWARLLGQSHRQSWEGDAQPGFDGDIQGVQAGLDLYANAGGSYRDQFGVYVGRTRAQGNVQGFAIGWENVAVGRTRLDDKHAGLYWTRAGSAGGYLDVVVMQSRYNGNATSARGIGIDVDGDGTTASMEVGKPLLRLGQSAWWLEPQLQVIWQRTSVDDTADRIAQLRFASDSAWTGRIGLRLAGDYGIAGNGWQPYFKVNYWQTLDGQDRVDFDTNRITSEQGGRALEAGFGLVARFNSTVSAFAVADYTWDLESSPQKERRVFEGNVGLRLDF